MITSRKLVPTIAITILSCSPCCAWQSGSRSAAPVGGSASRALAPSNLGAAPQSFSTPSFSSGGAPSISTPSFQPSVTQGFGGQPAFSDFQTSPAIQGQFAAPESVLQNGSPMLTTQNQFGSQFGSVQPQMPVASSGGSAVGIPQSSLVDPVFEINNPASNIAIDHSAWDNFLSRYLVTDAACVNRLRYQQVSSQDHCALKRYVGNLQSVDTRNLNRNEQLAFWFNLYNARTADLVLDHYPIRSVRQIKMKLTDFVGPFDDEGAVTVLGKPLSLNDIESGIIRPVWNDPRIHYALNCASYGCPNLAAHAWKANDLEGQLNGAAVQYINSGRAVKRGPFGVRTSKIFKWYKDDFGGSDEAVLNHMRQYANADTQQKLNGVNEISGHFYDWSLNDGRILRRRFLEPVIR